MIDINEADVVVARRTGDGRFLIFISTDVQPGWPLSWWGVVLDTGGDGFGLLVRLDESAAPSGWTARQLLEVALARARAEAGRGPDRSAAEVERHLAAAARSAAQTAGGTPYDPVALRPGPSGSPYAWTVALHGEFALTLCPDPESLEEGITPEQLLILLDQLLHDAAVARPRSAWIGATRRHVSAALAAETRRTTTLRRVRRRPTSLSEES